MADLPALTLRVRAEPADELTARLLGVTFTRCPPSRDGAMCGCDEDGEPEPERCPECHMPLTLHHDPMCGQPCGACADAGTRSPDALVIRLPRLLAGPHADYTVTVGRRWAQLLPGLEASLECVSGGQEGATAMIALRLAPADGQCHD